MTTLTLERYAYSETETEGWLWLDDSTRLHTIERPWKPGKPGGLPFVSCIPDGEGYSLETYVRSNHDVVFRLHNPDLHVYPNAEDRPDGVGRYAVLIHIGNYVDDVVGCIAPGLDRIIHKGRPMVTNSRKAMEAVMATRATKLNIVCVCGTDDA